MCCCLLLLFDGVEGGLALSENGGYSSGGFVANASVVGSLVMGARRWRPPLGRARRLLACINFEKASAQFTRRDALCRHLSLAGTQEQYLVRDVDLSGGVECVTEAAGTGFARGGYSPGGKGFTHHAVPSVLCIALSHIRSISIPLKFDRSQSLSTLIDLALSQI